MLRHSIAKERTQHLVEARGIFCQQQAQCASFHLDTLPTPKGWLELFNARDNWFPGDIERLRGCNCRQGIIDVIKSRQGNNDLSLLCWRLDLHMEPVKAIAIHFHSAHACLGACALAIRTSIVP